MAAILRLTTGVAYVRSWSGTLSGATLGVDTIKLDSTNLDTILVRDAANTLALKNGTNAQALRVYGTTTGNKYAALSADTSGHATLFIGGSWYFDANAAAGDGNLYHFRTGGGATMLWAISSTAILAGTDNTYSIGASGANRPKDLYLAGHANITTVTAETTAVSPLSITQTCNAAAVAFPGIKFVMTEGASGTAAGTNLIDLWYGTSGAEASIFKVSKLGVVTLGVSGSITAPSGYSMNENSLLRFSGQSCIGNNSDGVMYIANTARTGFTTLNLGPATGNTVSGTIQITKATATINTPSGTTATATNLIPAGALVLGVTGRITTGITGPTSIDVGDADTADLFLNDYATLTTAGNFGPTSHKAATWTGPKQYYTAKNVVVTANGGDFAGGAIYIEVDYINLIAKASA